MAWHQQKLYRSFAEFLFRTILAHNDDGADRLEQRKSVWLQFVQDGHASRERTRNLSSPAKAPSGSYLSTSKNKIAPRKLIVNE